MTEPSTFLHPQRPNRKPLRLGDFDYRSPNAYFITITTHNRRAILARGNADQVMLTRIGHLVSRQWHSIGSRFPSVELDEFVLMPDHFHAIVFLGTDIDVPTVGAGLARPEREAGDSPSLGRIIGAFKSLTTIAVNRLAKTPGARLWQRGYHDRVIRDEAELVNIREYIKNNPDAFFLSRLWR